MKKGLMLLVMLFVAIHIMISFIFNHKYVVVSDSMNPTLLKGDAVFCTLCDSISSINCGDIVFFKKNEKDSLMLFVKRVKYVNNVNKSPEYYMLGDNYGNSYDSRDYGWIRRSDILGKVSFVFWSWDYNNNRLRTNRFFKRVQ